MVGFRHLCVRSLTVPRETWEREGVLCVDGFRVCVERCFGVSFREAETTVSRKYNW